MKRVCIWAGATIVGLLAMEGAARLLSRPWPTLADFALRRETLAAAQAAAPVRVLFVGDSIVYGHDVAPDQAYPALLGGMWQAAHPDVRVEFVNGGTNGLTTMHGVQLLPLLVRTFRPQVVVLGFGLNDANLARSYSDARLEDAFTAPKWIRVLRHSRLFVGVERRWRRWQAQYAAWEGKRWEPRVSGPVFAQALGRMCKRARKAGAQAVLLTTTPLAPDFRPDVDDASRLELRQSCDDYNARVRAVAREERVHVLDVYGELRLEAGDWLEDGVHLSASGYRKLAAYLYVRLEPLLLDLLGRG
ncbi:MAG: SGNH/GDSL hydrolase family protein [Anaerolineae bacterium]|nr:SGNH/GDSL hydrolase family protein [Anaerolineae bacterium]